MTDDSECDFLQISSNPSDQRLTDAIMEETCLRLIQRTRHYKPVGMFQVFRPFEISMDDYNVVRNNWSTWLDSIQIPTIIRACQSPFPADECLKRGKALFKQLYNITLPEDPPIAFRNAKHY